MHVEKTYICAIFLIPHPLSSLEKVPPMSPTPDSSSASWRQLKISLAGRRRKRRRWYGRRRRITGSLSSSFPLLFPGAFSSTISSSSSSSLVLSSFPTARTVSSAPGRSFPSPSARTEKSPVLILAYFCYHCCSTVSSNESLCREREIKKKYREEENLSKVGGKLRYCCAGTCQ